MRDADILHPRGRGGPKPPQKAPPPAVKAPPPVKKQPPPVKPPARPGKLSLIGSYLPSLIRFLILAGGIVAIVYGAMYYLVNNVQVQPREMTEIVEIPKAGK
jgi:hypothetical protein